MPYHDVMSAYTFSPMFKVNYFTEFSDESSDDDNVDLSKMTEEEKKKYFEEKAKRKEAREKRRKEKYGDKYEEMAARREA